MFPNMLICQYWNCSIVTFFDTQFATHMTGINVGVRNVSQKKSEDELVDQPNPKTLTLGGMEC